MKSNGGSGISGMGNRKVASFAARSTSPFPIIPLCPEIHAKVTRMKVVHISRIIFLATGFCGLLRIYDRYARKESEMIESLSY